MANNDEKYGLNRNLWRRVYGRTRQKPRVVQFFDSGSQKTISTDLTKTFRHRDYFNIQGINRKISLFDLPSISSSLAEYEEGLVAFNNESSKTASFSTSFTNAPYVVYTVEPAGNNSDNVNVFGISVPTLTQMFIGLSAPFSGNVRYRAVYSPSYPIAASSPYTGSMQIYAGEVDITNATSYTASFSLPTGTLEFRASFHDSLSNSETNIQLINESLSTTQATNELTAESSGKIHFLAFSL